MSQTPTSTHNEILTLTKISFKACLKLGSDEFPIGGECSAIIRNGERDNFINRAVVLYKEIFNEQEILVACKDFNNFLDCIQVGKILGVDFTYQIECL